MSVSASLAATGPPTLLPARVFSGIETGSTESGRTGAMFESRKFAAGSSVIPRAVFVPCASLYSTVARR